MVLRLGRVVFGLTAMFVGGAAARLGAGDVGVGLLAMSRGLSREPLPLDLALGVAAPGHRRDKRDDHDGDDDNDDDQGG